MKYIFAILAIAILLISVVSIAPLTLADDDDDDEDEFEDAEFIAEEITSDDIDNALDSLDDDTVFISLDSATNPSETFTLEGESFVVELISASNDDAILKITDDSNTSEQAEITEGDSKNLLGIEIELTLADESEALNIMFAELTIRLVDNDDNNECESKTEVKVKGDISITSEIQETIDELVSSLEGSEGKVELRLEVEKDDDELDIEAKIKKGSLNSEQKVLWETLQDQVKDLFDEIGNDDSELEIRIKVENKCNEDDDDDDEDDERPRRIGKADLEKGFGSMNNGEQGHLLNIFWTSQTFVTTDSDDTSIIERETRVRGELVVLGGDRFILRKSQDSSNETDIPPGNETDNTNQTDTNQTILDATLSNLLGNETDTNETDTNETDPESEDTITFDVFSSNKKKIGPLIGTLTLEKGSEFIGLTRWSGFLVLDSGDLEGSWDVSIATTLEKVRKGGVIKNGDFDDDSEDRSLRASDIAKSKANSRARFHRASGMIESISEEDLTDLREILNRIFNRNRARA